MKNMKSIITILFLIMISAGDLVAQDASEAAREYYQALESGEYRKAAGSFTPEALNSIRDFFDLGEVFDEERATEFYKQFFGPEASKASVGKMSDLEFVAAWFSSLFRQAAAVGAIRAIGEVEVLGEIKEGENTAHVLTKHGFPAEERELEVLTFRRIDGQWKATLSGKMKDIASRKQKQIRMLKKALEMRKAPQH